MEHAHGYQSSEFQYIGFDELTQFREADYLFLFSRLRRRQGSLVPLRMRSASNPGGDGHEWVRRRFLSIADHSTRIYLPARLADNPHLDAVEYQRSLALLDPVTRQRLLAGDWEIDDTDRLISYDMLAGCTADCLWPKGPGGAMPPRNRPMVGRPLLYLGVDIGRSRDRTVLWTWEQVGDVCWCREVCVLHQAPFAEQREEITRRLAAVAGCAIDRGGIGQQLAEELEQAYPGIVQGVTLSAGVQGRLAGRFATALAERRVRLPDDPELRDDFRLIRAPRRVGGIDRIETERGPTGHADRFWAAALGYDLAQIHAPPPASLPRGIRGR